MIVEVFRNPAVIDLHSITIMLVAIVVISVDVGQLIKTFVNVAQLINSFVFIRYFIKPVAHFILLTLHTLHLGFFFQFPTTYQ